MEQHIDAFIEAHPNGWSHDAWLGLVSELEGSGFDIGDRADLGLTLENRRLARTLGQLGVPGLGPKRTEAIVDTFGTLWRLRHTNAGELSEIKTISAPLAERVVRAVRALHP